MKSKPDPESLALTSLVFIAVLLLSLALVVVTVLAESLPAGSVALAVAVMVPSPNPEAPMALTAGSEERRGGEEWRSRGSPDHLKKKKGILAPGTLLPCTTPVWRRAV